MTANIFHQDDTAALARQLHAAVAKLTVVLRPVDTSDNALDPLSISQHLILLILHEHGAMRISELAVHERVHVATMWLAIRRLKKLGLVELVSVADDLGDKLVKITAEGRDAYQRSLAGRLEHVSQALTHLSHHQFDELTTSLSALERLADALSLEPDPSSRPGRRPPTPST